MEEGYKNFGLIGVAGYIAVRHLRAIKETMAKRESKQDTRPRRRADLRIIKGKKGKPNNK